MNHKYRKVKIATTVTNLVLRTIEKGSAKADPLTMVELQGLEPWTSSMPWKRSSQLSYSPVELNEYSKILRNGEVSCLFSLGYGNLL